MKTTMTETPKSRHPFLDFIQAAFILTDVHGKILYCNRYTENLFGYTREEIEGQRIRTFFFTEDLKYFLPNIVYLAIYRAGFEGDGLLRQKNGKGIFIHLSASSFKEGGETFLAFSFQEIQRLKRLEREKLELRHRASLGMMVEEVAHQIRNPIASIGGYARRMMKASVSSQKTEIYVDRILHETRRLEEKIQRMEELVKIPRPIFQKEKVLEVVEKTLQSVSQEEKTKGVSLNLEEGSLEEEECFYIDKDLITRALSHLLENSIESVKQGRRKRDRMRIGIGLACDAESIEISISDRGEGISKKNLSRICEPFFSTRPERAGLGLTFVKRVVEDHGGKIRIDSRLRVGTTVTLIFPKDRRRPIRREWVSPEAEHSFSSL
ncbi:MAG: PAS domain S-box protein [Deltaproteobacteria bacterium]|nr:PAS domain S-box protein [Deltaproteobacteria bacterium]